MRHGSAALPGQWRCALYRVGRLIPKRVDRRTLALASLRGVRTPQQFYLGDDKRLVLPVPFGCAIEEARDEVEKAIHNLAVEIGSISVKSA
jgi:hypothetical protein